MTHLRLSPSAPAAAVSTNRAGRSRGARHRRAVAVASSTLLSVTMVAGGVALSPSAQAVSTDLVISEVYGGGGNSGATLTNDFVELYNLSDNAVDLSGWKIQYYSATGTSPSTTSLDGTIAPSASFLVQMAKGAGGTTPLPTPDATGMTAMSATSGRVDLLDGTALVDRVGYGGADTFEGAAAPGTTNTTSVSRTSPCTDTDVNSSDFAAGPPTPRNSAAGPEQCTPVVPPPPEPETIEQIQGASHLSPYAGQPVDGVEGVVTVVGPSGFWLQSAQPDDDPATSEGIYVFTRGSVPVAVGDAVTVDGVVQEFRPGGSGGNDNLTTTEITSPTVTVDSQGNALPAPVVLGVDRTAPPQTIEQVDPGSVEYSDVVFDPAVNAIDFYESLEGMLVTVHDAEVVGPTASFGEIPVVPGNVPADAAVRTPRGGVLYSGYDHPNAMRVQLDDALLPTGSMPQANVGDTLVGDTTGVMDYSFSNFKLEVLQPPVVQPGGLQREVTQAARPSELAVATFNVENLSPSDPATKFDRLAMQIVHNLKAPDVLALEEIQDNSGPADDGTVASDVTVSTLEAAIVAAGGPQYDARWIDPQNRTDGGQPGGNIRSVLMFRTDRGLQFVDRPGADATTATEVVTVHGRPQLTYSPGRIDPANSAWNDSRKPLVGQFRWHGQDVFVIANHFSSKGGDDPLFGRWQQPVRFSEVARHAQAEVERTFLDQLLGASPDAKVVVLGDLNDFEFSQTADILVGSGDTALVDLPRKLPVNERYTYVFEGNSQVLDHILLSQSLAHGPGRGHGPAAYEYDIVHTNSEFADQDSDHDPQVVRVRPRGR